MDLNTLLKTAKENKNIVPKGFIETDNFHFIKRLKEDKYHVVEIIESPDSWYYVSSVFVCLSDYVSKKNFPQKFLNINGYKSLYELEQEYGEDWANLIIACFIEDLEDYKNADLKGFKTIREVEDYLVKINVPIDINWNI